MGRVWTTAGMTCYYEALVRKNIMEHRHTVVAEVLDEAELDVLDGELDELEDWEVGVGVGVGVGVWLVVEGVGRWVLAGRWVVAGGGGELEVAVLKSAKHKVQGQEKYTRGSDEDEAWGGGALLLLLRGSGMPLGMGSLPFPWRATSLRWRLFCSRVMIEKESEENKKNVDAQGRARPGWVGGKRMKRQPWEQGYGRSLPCFFPFSDSIKYARTSTTLLLHASSPSILTILTTPCPACGTS